MTASAKARWNAADYAANSVVQQAWARELIAHLKLRGDEHVLDVGCGDGKVTAELAGAAPRGTVTGIDASAEMVDFARKTFPKSKFANLDFQQMDAGHIDISPPGRGENSPNRPSHIEPPNPTNPYQRSGNVQEFPLSRRTGEGRGEGRVQGEGEEASKFDLIFSNAALHWMQDHQAFLRGASACLKPGGRLMVSCGGKGNAHDVVQALLPEMRKTRWRAFFRKMPKPYFFYAPEDYEKWLPRFGFKMRRVKLAPKDATYPGRDGFATWLRTTWLPYTQRVPAPEREEFIAAAADRYVVKHPVDAAGHVHVRMVRLEIDAIKV